MVRHAALRADDHLLTHGNRVLVEGAGLADGVRTSQLDRRLSRLLEGRYCPGRSRRRWWPRRRRKFGRGRQAEDLPPTAGAEASGDSDVVSAVRAAHGSSVRCGGSTVKGAAVCRREGAGPSDHVHESPKPSPSTPGRRVVAALLGKKSGTQEGSYTGNANSQLFCLL